MDTCLQLGHGTAIYRACRRERRRLLEQSATIRRVRLDTELKSAVARRSESARMRDGRQAADAERHRAGRELGLPIGPEGCVVFPDAQIEYTGPDKRSGRVNIEVASGHHRARSIRTKANAGFVLYANGAAKARLLRALRLALRSEDRASTRGAARQDPKLFEL